MKMRPVLKCAYFHSLQMCTVFPLRIISFLSLYPDIRLRHLLVGSKSGGDAFYPIIRGTFNFVSMTQVITNFQKINFKAILSRNYYGITDKICSCYSATILL